MQCVDADTAYAWVGDGFCDDGDFGMYLLCEFFDFDGGDCGGTDTGGTTGGTADCDDCGMCNGDGSTCAAVNEPPAWDCDGDNLFDYLNDYENSLSITSGVYFNSEYSVNESDMLAAYVGNELRGATNPLEAPFGPNVGDYQFLMLVYSNEPSGETVNFKYFDSSVGIIYDIYPP